MRKDFKTGLVVGMFILIGGTIWLSTQKVLSPEQKMANVQRQSHLHPAVSQPLSPPIETPPAPAQPQPVPITPQQPEEAIPQSQETPPVATPPASSRPVTEPAEPIQSQPKHHIVQSGETLSEIAYHYYGSYNQWRKIQAANPELLANPNKLKVGIKLLIPQ